MHDSHVRAEVRSAVQRDVREEWWFDAIRAARAWDTLRADAPVRVCVIDVGVAIEHPLLRDRVCEGWNFVDDNADVRPPPGRHHGTQIAAIIARLTAINPRIEIMPLRTRGPDRESLGHLVSALRYALANGAQVVSVSYRIEANDSTALEIVLREAQARGVILVVSAGNENADLTRWSMLPATFGLTLPNVITVQAAGRPGQYFPDSNYFPAMPLLAAPGVGIATILNDASANDGWTNMRGTSAAAPIVAGSIALLLSDARFASRARDMQALLLGTAREYPQEVPGRAHQRSMRLLDLEAAVHAGLWGREHCGNPP